MTSDLEKKYKKLVIVLSIVIPVVIATLFRIKVEGYDLSVLPPIYASINALTAVTLIASLLAIKSGNQETHKKLMLVALGLSLMFLVCYVLYHLTSDSTIFGDLNHDGTRDAIETQKIGSLRFVYLFVLLTHILLSMIVLPLVMMTYLKGWAGNLSSHRKWAKFTFPIWLYVAVSGVIVFLMIRPYYS